MKYEYIIKQYDKYEFGDKRFEPINILTGFSTKKEAQIYLIKINTEKLNDEVFIKNEFEYNISKRKKVYQ